MKWKVPHVIKVYEALGCISDKRIEIKESGARVYSSSGNKFYLVYYDANKNSIMCNDNGSYYIGYLGYPAIAYLMKIGKLNFSKKYAEALKGIHWKNINQRNKNNFKKTKEEIDILIEGKGINLIKFNEFLEEVLIQINSKKLNLLGDKITPPKGY